MHLRVTLVRRFNSGRAQNFERVPEWPRKSGIGRTKQSNSAVSEGRSQVERPAIDAENSRESGDDSGDDGKRQARPPRRPREVAPASA